MTKVKTLIIDLFYIAHLLVFTNMIFSLTCHDSVWPLCSTSIRLQGYKYKELHPSGDLVLTNFHTHDHFPCSFCFQMKVRQVCIRGVKQQVGHGFNGLSSNSSVSGACANVISCLSRLCVCMCVWTVYMCLLCLISAPHLKKQGSNISYLVMWMPQSKTSFWWKIVFGGN